MNKEIKISIIAAVYNLEEYLPRCMEALVNQTLKDIEIICVDDGSTDSAPQIIDSYAEKYPDLVKVFHKENGGEFTTRNYGLERATGKYVTFVDTDDYVELDWAEKMYNAAEKTDADLVVCGFERIDMDTNEVVSKNMVHMGDKLKSIDYKDDFIIFINPAPWNKLYKREKIKDNRFFSLRGFNDMIFLISSYATVENVMFVPEVLYHYYLRKTSQIHTLNQKDVDNLKEYLLKLKEFYIKNGKYEDMKYILDLVAFIHLGISTMYRISYNKDMKLKETMKDTIQYLDENFSTWRKSPFLKFGYSVKRGIKHIGLWGISLMYKMKMYVLFIKIYRFFVDKLNVDIKF